MDTKIIEKVQKHDVVIAEIKQEIKFQYEDVRKALAALPHQIQQEMSIKWAERDEQKRKDQNEVRMWFIGMVFAIGVASVGGWIWLLHERDTVKEDHTLIAQVAKTATQADHKSDQALNSITKMNDKLDLVIYFHKKDNRE